MGFPDFMNIINTSTPPKPLALIAAEGFTCQLSITVDGETKVLEGKEISVDWYTSKRTDANGNVATGFLSGTPPLPQG